jgi:hypothetical protein
MGQLIEVDSEQQRAAAHQRRRMSRLTAGVAGTNDNHIVGSLHSVV